MSDLAIEDESILAGIFQDSFPNGSQDNGDFLQYLKDLSSYGIDKLAREPDRLSEERAQILEETQNLAFHNYKTFIQTAECSKEIFQDFQIIETHVEDMLDKLPSFSAECKNILQKAKEINTSRGLNTLTLHRHTQLLEILEIPQLMDTCVRNAYYEEALDLTAYVKRLEKKHANIPVIAEIVKEVKTSTQLMLNQLIQQLRTNIQLPACLRVIGYLRRMDIFTEVELRIKFLQARDTWFTSILDAIPKTDAYIHITKTIEASRVHLFDIITQYRAIFSDEDPILTSTKENVGESILFSGWVVEKVSQFLRTLETDLAGGIGGRLDSILGQTMYFGLSFSRVGADFRGLIAPIFQRAAVNTFTNAMKEATTRFDESMQSYTFQGTGSTLGGLSYSSPTQTGQLYPPTVLLDFQPLAVYCNNVLSAFNELRVCAPITGADDVAKALERSLLDVNRIILAYHRAEESTFYQKEQEQFNKFCQTYVFHLVPYLNKCLQTLFPPQDIAQILGVQVSELSKLDSLGTIRLSSVTEPLQHLLPVVESAEQIADLTTDISAEKLPVSLQTEVIATVLGDHLDQLQNTEIKLPDVDKTTNELDAVGLKEQTPENIPVSSDGQSQHPVLGDDQQEVNENRIIKDDSPSIEAKESELSEVEQIGVSEQLDMSEDVKKAAKQD